VANLFSHVTFLHSQVSDEWSLAKNDEVIRISPAVAFAWEGTRVSGYGGHTSLGRNNTTEQDGLYWRSMVRCAIKTLLNVLKSLALLPFV